MVAQVLHNRQVFRGIGPAIQHVAEQVIPIARINSKQVFVFGREGTPVQEHRIGFRTEEFPALGGRHYLQGSRITRHLRSLLYPAGIKRQKSHLRVKEIALHGFGHTLTADFPQIGSRFVIGVDHGPFVGTDKIFRGFGIIFLRQHFG